MNALALILGFVFVVIVPMIMFITTFGEKPPEKNERKVKTEEEKKEETRRSIVIWNVSFMISVVLVPCLMLLTEFFGVLRGEWFSDFFTCILYIVASTIVCMIALFVLSYMANSIHVRFKNTKAWKKLLFFGYIVLITSAIVAFTSSGTI